MSKVEKAHAVAYAIKLLQAGFRARIVHIESGVDLSYLRAIAKELNHGARMSSGSLPRSGNILNARPAVMEASLWAGLYRSLGGETIYKHLNVDVVDKSHRLYIDLRDELPLRLDAPLDINRTWVLARDLRSDTAWLSRCHCGTVYIHALDQRAGASCPSCLYARDL